jgi:aspartyl protease family protein
MFGAHLKLSVAATLVALVMAHFLPQHSSRAPQARPGEHAALSAARPLAAVKAASAPLAPARVSSRGEYRIAADAIGQYSTDVEINGSRIHMLVDTGASSVALSYEDAAAIGIYPAPADYKYAVSTANGTGRVARVVLRDVRVGSLVVYDVEALIGERGALGSSLLGMTFLSKLRMEVASGALVLRQ